MRMPPDGVDAARLHRSQHPLVGQNTSMTFQPRVLQCASQSARRGSTPARWPLGSEEIRVVDENRVASVLRLKVIGTLPARGVRLHDLEGSLWGGPHARHGTKFCHDVADLLRILGPQRQLGEQTPSDLVLGMAPPAGLEPATRCLEGSRSIH